MYAWGHIACHELKFKLTHSPSEDNTHYHILLPTLVSLNLTEDLFPVSISSSCSSNALSPLHVQYQLKSEVDNSSLQHVNAVSINKGVTKLAKVSPSHNGVNQSIYSPRNWTALNQELVNSPSSAMELEASALINDAYSDDVSVVSVALKDKEESTSITSSLIVEGEEMNTEGIQALNDFKEIVSGISKDELLNMSETYLRELLMLVKSAYSSSTDHQVERCSSSPLSPSSHISIAQKVTHKRENECTVPTSFRFHGSCSPSKDVQTNSNDAFKALEEDWDYFFTSRSKFRKKIPAASKSPSKYRPRSPNHILSSVNGKDNYNRGYHDKEKYKRILEGIRGGRHGNRRGEDKKKDDSFTSLFTPELLVAASSSYGSSNKTHVKKVEPALPSQLKGQSSHSNSRHVKNKLSTGGSNKKVARHHSSSFKESSIKGM
jgi:hypothetical protein